MKKMRCDYCGADIDDCDCENMREWYGIDECLPDHGQRCRVKREQIFDARFSVKDDYQFMILNNVGQGKTVAWQPVSEYLYED